VSTARCRVRHRRGGCPVIADRCPGVLRLHAAADGHMARIRLPGGVLHATGLAAVAALAARGNGAVEVTGRASLQVRGLAEADAAWAADLVGTAGLLPSPAHDRVRNILASPFGGRHPRAALRTDDLVAALDRGLCRDDALTRLPGRFLFAVEDGSGTLGRSRADVTLVACDGGTRLRLDLAGHPTTLGAGPAGAPALALDAARAFLALLEGDGGEGWRIDDLPDGAARVAHALDGALSRDAAPAGAAPVAAGALEQGDGRVAITALVPLGRLDAATLTELGALLDDDVRTVRLSPARTLTLVDVPPRRAPRLIADLEGLELVTTCGSGWEGISACAGLGACVNAQVDVRGAATRRAAARRTLAGPLPAEHWTACDRGCGRPVEAPVLVIAGPDAVRVQRAGTTAVVASVDDALALLAAGDPAS
jgi:sulfite reductase beta subunit-like hemoprotein